MPSRSGIDDTRANATSRYNINQVKNVAYWRAMGRRALDWLVHRERFEAFRLTILGKNNPRVFFSVTWQTKFDSTVNLISLANDLLKIDFESFFLDMAEVNRSFRSKYPVPREPWLASRLGTSSVESASGNSVYQSKRDSFRAAVEACRSGSPLPEQGDENAQRISDFERYREDFSSLLLKNTDGELLPATRDHIWKMVEFSFLDDNWLSMEGDSFADAELFRLWANACRRIGKIYRSASTNRGDGFGMANHALTFDQMTGIDPGRSDCLKFEREKGSRFAAELFLPKPRCKTALVQHRSRCNSGRDVALAISGLVWLECLRLFELSDKLRSCINDMERIVSSFLCPSPAYVGLRRFEEIASSPAYKEIQRYEKMVSLANGALEEIEVYEKKIGDAELRPYSFRLKYLLSVAEKYQSLCKSCDSSGVLWHIGFPRQDRLLVRFFGKADSDDEAIDFDYEFGIVSILRAWSDCCRDSEVYAFPEYYCRILSAALHAGLTPKKCKYCGGLFFPEAPNQQYCKRVIRQSGVKCSDMEQRIASREKRSFNSKLQSVKAKAKRAKGKSITAQRYYEDLADYIRNEAGPLYQSSELVDRTTYDWWLNAVIGPKSGALSRLRTQEYPYPLIWTDKVVKGTEWVNCSKIIAQEPSLKDFIFDTGGSRFKVDDVVFLSGDIVFVKSSWLLRSVIRFNGQHCNNPLPVPGLSESVFVNRTHAASEENPSLPVRER